MKPAATTQNNLYFLAPSLRRFRITQLAGHNIETRGRELVNGMLKDGWLLLHIYTLRYQEDGILRERPMAILGKPEGSRK